MTKIAIQDCTPVSPIKAGAPLALPEEKRLIVLDLSPSMETSWTVGDLKEHLVNELSVRSPPSAQKLIAFGRLLKDTESLSDLIRVVRERTVLSEESSAATASVNKEEKEEELLLTLHLVVKMTDEQMSRITTPAQPESQVNADRLNASTTSGEILSPTPPAGDELPRVEKQIVIIGGVRYEIEYALPAPAPQASRLTLPGENQQPPVDVAAQGNHNEDDEFANEDRQPFFYTLIRLLFLYFLLVQNASTTRFVFISLGTLAIGLAQFGFLNRQLWNRLVNPLQRRLQAPPTPQGPNGITEGAREERPSTFWSSLLSFCVSFISSALPGGPLPPAPAPAAVHP